MAFITDTFTVTSDIDLASHTGELGASYTDHPHANYTGTFTVDASTDRIFGAGTAGYYASGLPPSADYSIEADFYLHSAISQNVAVCVRMDTTDDTMIIARLNNGTIWEVREIVTGNATTLGSSTNQLPSAGTAKRGKLEVRGTQAFFYVDDVLEIGPVTVTITSAGRAGVRNAGVATATTGIHLDNLSANPLYVSVSLFRGRNFPFFDDEEVNRFEFWPAVTGVAAHERAAAVSASASIESSAQFFSVFERAVAVSSTASIASVGKIDYHRSVSVNASAAISSAGHRILERSLAINATGNIASSGQFFSVFERSSITNASALITVSRQIELNRSVSCGATGNIASSGFKVGPDHERSVSLSATANISASGQFFSIIERAALVNGTANIATAGSFFSILERVAQLNASASITVTGQKVLNRSVGVGAVGLISVTGSRVATETALVFASQVAPDQVGALVASEHSTSIVASTRRTSTV